MNLGITGVTGLIGRHLAELAQARGHQVFGFSRRPDTEVAGVTMLAQPGKAPWQLPEPESHLDALIHLAGESVLGLWTEGKRQRIRDSRVAFTEQLVSHLATWSQPPAALLCGSAVGYYGDRGDEVLRESSAPGQGFLAQVCVDWEKAGKAFEGRVCTLRTGLVLAADGGALPLMRKAFSLGAGGRLGSGKQWMPWIHIADEVGLILHAAETATLEGAINLTAPNPERNADFTRILAKAMKRPAFLPAPAFAMKAALGDMAREMLLSSQRTEAGAAQESGYRFAHPELAGALADLLA